MCQEFLHQVGSQFDASRLSFTAQNACLLLVCLCAVDLILFSVDAKKAYLTVLGELAW